MRIKWYCQKCKREEELDVKALEKVRGKIFMHSCKCGSPMMLIEVTREEEKQLLLSKVMK